MEQDKAAAASSTKTQYNQDNLSILAATASTQSQTNSHLLKLLRDDDYKPVNVS